MDRKPEKKPLYERYRNWCSANNHKQPMSVDFFLSIGIEKAGLPLDEISEFGDEHYAQFGGRGQEMDSELIGVTVDRLRRLADQIERGEVISHKWMDSGRGSDLRRRDFFDRGQTAFTLVYSKRDDAGEGYAESAHVLDEVISGKALVTGQAAAAFVEELLEQKGVLTVGNLSEHRGRVRRALGIGESK